MNELLLVPSTIVELGILWHLPCMEMCPMQLFISWLTGVSRVAWSYVHAHIPAPPPPVVTSSRARISPQWICYLLVTIVIIGNLKLHDFVLIQVSMNSNWHIAFSLISKLKSIWDFLKHCNHKVCNVLNLPLNLYTRLNHIVSMIVLSLINSDVVSWFKGTAHET